MRSFNKFTPMPSSHEKENKADPTKVTRIERPREDVPPIGKRNRQGFPGRPWVGAELDIRSGGEGTFHEIVAYPETQQFISRILKPFFAVADIVRTEKGWYSYEPSAESLKRQDDKQDFSADEVLLSFLIGDRDRPENAIWREGHYLMYDFERPYELFWEISEFDFGSWVGSWLKSHRDSIPYVLEKLERMRAYYESDSGREQVEAAFQATGKSMAQLFISPEGKESTFEDFYQELLHRVRVLHEAAKGQQTS